MTKLRIPLFVLAAMVLGVLFGYFFPSWGVAVKPLGDGFIRLIKMIIIPVVVTTLIVGISGVQDIKRMGRIGVKAVLWFEFITTLILFLGLIIGNLLQPGVGVDFKNLPKADISALASNTAKVMDAKTLILNIIPTNIIDSLARADLLAVIFFCIMFGIALVKVGKAALPLINTLDIVSKASFELVNMVMIVSPIGVFALTAFTVGMYGVAVLLPLMKLIGTAYLGLLIIVFGLFPLIALFLKVKIKDIYKMLWDLMLIGASATSLEPILPELMKRVEKFGVPKYITSFVIPAGIPFNADGSALYLTIASTFIAQAFGVEMSFTQQITMILIFMVTSKGMAAVPSSSMVILLATSTAVGLPAEGVALILGIDRVIDMARTAVNIMGHTFAAIAVSKWEGVFEENKPVKDEDTITSAIHEV